MPEGVSDRNGLFQPTTAYMHVPMHESATANALDVVYDLQQGAGRQTANFALSGTVPGDTWTGMPGYYRNQPDAYADLSANTDLLEFMLPPPAGSLLVVVSVYLSVAGVTDPMSYGIIQAGNAASFGCWSFSFARDGQISPAVLVNESATSLGAEFSSQFVSANIGFAQPAMLWAMLSSTGTSYLGVGPAFPQNPFATLPFPVSISDQALKIALFTRFTSSVTDEMNYTTDKLDMHDLWVFRFETQADVPSVTVIGKILREIEHTPFEWPISVP